MSKPYSKHSSSSYRSQKKTVASLSIFEKLGVIPVLLTVVANVFASFVTGLIRPKSKRPLTFYRYVALTAIRTLCRKATPRQQHLIGMPTDDAYLVACKKRGVSPRSEVLEDGTTAHWIGDGKGAEKLILNFHGGGYCFPAGAEMFEFMFQVVDALNKQDKKVACLFLSYDLAPGAHYPRQLQQASMLLNHILYTLSIPPSSIILTGDSAGANLCLALLSHISHPHPSTTLPIPKISLPNNTSLRGVVLISPWVDFRLSLPSFERNKYKDCIDVQCGKTWSGAWLDEAWPHEKKTDYYNQAITAPEEWWGDLKVEEVLIMAGEEEVLVDGIVEFERKFRRGFEGGDKRQKMRVELLVAKGEYHDQPSVDLQFGYKEHDEGEQAKRIKSWLASRF